MPDLSAIPYKYLFLVTILGMLPFLALAQEQQGGLHGRVTDPSGESMPGITVMVEEAGRGVATDVGGSYLIESLSPGRYTLVFSGVGLRTQTVPIQVAAGKAVRVDLTMDESIQEMDEVVVTGKTEASELQERPFNLNVIDTRPIQNSNLDISQVLSRTTGINIREEGGLGSGFDFSLNGLSGKQVKFFVDGIPMDNYGSSLSINNIPVNLIERVEVYKGVVPVSLGADALGGAVNIITKQNVENYLDASYSFGSFNTHRVAVSGKYRIKNTGLFVEAAAFHNYSDNDYWVDVQIPDPETGKIDEYTRVRRFHDAYRSTMVQLKAGVQDQKFADELSIGVATARNRNDVQHGTSLERVFGQIHTTDEVFIPSIEYRKSGFLLKNLDARFYASYIDGQYLVVDTSSRTYDWYGNYQLKNNPSIGEAQWEKTLFSFNDKTTLSVNNLNYEITELHQLAFNHTFSRFERVGEDPLDPNTVAFSDPNYLDKHVFGLAYTVHGFDKRLTTSLFSKYYSYRGKAIEVDWDDQKTVTTTDTRKPGYGVASTYFIRKGLQAKVSYENTYRLPEGYEMFGDGLLTLNNPGLQPEHSSNVNAGVRYVSNASRKHTFSVEGHYFYRDIENLIRAEATGITSQYVNVNDASSAGMEGEVTYQFNKLFSLGVNATYQNLVNKTKYDAGRLNPVYLDRIPNIPYLFGNFYAGVQLHDLLLDDDHLGIRWYTRYIHEYYLKWPSQGDPGNKHVIPEQVVHNLELNYSLQQGRYNLALGSTNLLDSKVYDKFRIQKPGRALYVKLRYFINQY